MFSGSNGWSGPNGGGLPRYYPPSQLNRRVPSLLNQTWLTPPPVPPRMPPPTAKAGLFTGLFTNDVRNKEFTHVRVNYNQEKQPKNKKTFIPLEVRPFTEPMKINEKEFNELKKKVKKGLTDKMKEDETMRKFKTDETLLLNGARVVLSDEWNPYERLDLSKTTYPRKKTVQQLFDDSTNHDDNEYIVQTATRLVRNHNTASEARGFNKISRNMTWTREDAAQEQSNSTSESDKSTPEPEVMIQLEDSVQFPNNPSPSDSSNGVIVVCKEKSSKLIESPSVHVEVSSTSQTQTASPQRIVKTVKSSTMVTKSVFDRSQMSLRNINGKKITGDSRECYANITGECKVGIFCRFEHEGSNEHSSVKICQRLLRGLCRPDNRDCPYEHSALLPHQYPMCIFYKRGDCVAGEQCKLLHVRHSTNAGQCLDFIQGRCMKGVECDHPHAYPYAVWKEKGASEERSNGHPSEKGETLRWID